MVVLKPRGVGRPAQRQTVKLRKAVFLLAASQCGLQQVGRAPFGGQVGVTVLGVGRVFTVNMLSRIYFSVKVR